MDNLSKESCRICLKNKGIISIFDKVNDLTIIECMMHIFNVEIYLNNKFPTSICTICNRKLKIALELKNAIESSENNLREFFSTISPAKPKLVEKKSMVTVTTYETSTELDNINNVKSEFEEMEIQLTDDENIEHQGEEIILQEIEGDDDLNDIVGDIEIIEQEDSEATSPSQSITETEVEIITELEAQKLEKPSKRIQRNKKHQKAGASKDEKILPDEFDDNFGDLKCETCNKEFRLKSQLDSHLKCHEISKPFKCNICQKCFTAKYNLVVHQRTHTKEKPYVCDICSKQFISAGYLRQHMATHASERIYSCDQCEKTFNSKKTLRAHSGLHTGVKNHACPHCDKSFYVTNYLTKHVRTVHYKERSFVCSVCEKSFSNSSNLASHVRIHTGEKPFQCKYCDAKFNQSSPLVRHTQQHLKNGDKMKPDPVTSTTSGETKST